MKNRTRGSWRRPFVRDRRPPAFAYYDVRMVLGVVFLGLVGLLFAAPARLSPKKRVEPVYSEEAREAHISGRVVLSVTIGTNGRVKYVKVVKSLGFGLDENAVRAIHTWEFSPATNDEGIAVESTIPIECHFDTK